MGPVKNNYTAFGHKSPHGDTRDVIRPGVGQRTLDEEKQLEVFLANELPQFDNVSGPTTLMQNHLLEDRYID